MLSADLSLLRENVTEGVVPITDSAGDFSFSGVNSEKPEFRAAVGLSRKWDAREAGREVAIDTLNKLGAGVKPDFFLLFSTIHYEKWGGFKEFLKGIWDILPEGTPLIGGTVAGFINPEGCFTRGATAIAVNYPNMDVAVGVGHNTKRAPHLAAKGCAGMIEKGLKDSKFTNKFLLNLVSGVTTPKIPGYPDNLRVIHSKFLSKLLLLGSILSLKVLQKGPGMEEAIIEKMADELPDYQMIGGSFIDNNKGYSNYQFYKNKVYTNTLMGLGISTDKQVKVNSTFGLIETDKRFKITKKSMYDLLIEKINNRNALTEMLTLMNWPMSFLSDSARILTRTFYTPIGYMVDGKRYISVMAFIFGESIMVSPKVRCEDACIMTTSGEKLIQSVEENLRETKDKNIQLGIITSCIVRLETLGSNVYNVHEILRKHFKGKPFLQIDVVGEDIYTKEIGAKRIAESYNTAIFYD